MEGGKKYVNDFFKTGILKWIDDYIKKTEKELKSIRNRVSKSFEKISCALLPGNSKYILLNSIK